MTMYPLIHTRGRHGRAWDGPADIVRREFDRMAERWGWPGWADDDLVAQYPVDLREDEQHVYVDAELPGFTKDDLDVRLDHGDLHIVAERAPEELPGTKHLHERRYRRVERHLALPVEVDDGKTEAHFENGVLHLTIPKRPEQEKRRIKIM
jgi:HSP20 family protein